AVASSLSTEQPGHSLGAEIAIRELDLAARGSSLSGPLKTSPVNLRLPLRKTCPRSSLGVLCEGLRVIAAVPRQSLPCVVAQSAGSGPSEDARTVTARAMTHSQPHSRRISCCAYATLT